MIRLVSLLFVLLCTACGDDGSAMPDAPMIMIDAPPPIDALMCASPTKLCGTTCRSRFTS